MKKTFVKHDLNQRAQVKQLSLPSWLWLMAGLILGIVASSVFYYSFESRPSAKYTNPKPQASTPKAQKPNQARFDFYRVLPSLKEDVLSEGTENLEKTNQQYIIQIGSFREFEQAEALKAQLALLGFEASIQTINSPEKASWYRVYIGPFKTKEMAARKQQQIEQAQELHSLVLKFRV